MSGCKGLHCPGCGNGGSGLAVAVLGVTVAAVVLRKPVEHAADVLLHIVLIILAAIAGLGVTGAAVFVAVRSRRRRAEPDGRPLTQGAAPPRAVQARTAPRRELPAPQVHLHFHGPVLPDDLAAIIDRSRELPGPGQHK